MRTAHKKYLAEFGRTDPLTGNALSKANPTRRLIAISSNELQDARSELKEAMYRFLIRCHNERVIDAQTIHDVAGRLDISVAAEHLIR
jgi:hypothetical protein